MAKREEVDLLAKALSGLSYQAQKDLALIVKGYEASGADLAKEMPEAWGGILEKYGSASSNLGAEMFQQWADRLNLRGPKLKVVRAQDPQKAQARLQWALDQPNPLGNMRVLLDELVKQPARSTLAASAGANGVKWARVPSGPKTCAFCYMLASRGAVYHTEVTAGKLTKFHGLCDCQIVPIKSPSDYPDGYDPDAMYEKYAEARDAATEGGDAIDVNQVLSRMRVDMRDILSDGVEPPEVRAERKREADGPEGGVKGRRPRKDGRVRGPRRASVD